MNIYVLDKNGLQYATYFSFVLMLFTFILGSLLISTFFFGTTLICAIIYFGNEFLWKDYQIKVNQSINSKNEGKQ